MENDKFDLKSRDSNSYRITRYVKTASNTIALFFCELTYAT